MVSFAQNFPIKLAFLLELHCIFASSPVESIFRLIKYGIPTKKPELKNKMLQKAVIIHQLVMSNLSSPQVLDECCILGATKTA